MYFKNIPKTSYRFGDLNDEAMISNLTAYSEVLDTIKGNAAFYQDYYIQHDERPDHVSYKLYKNPQLHWTIYLLNPKLRENGWPLSDLEVLEKVKKQYPDTTLNTDEDISQTFHVGQVVTGQMSGASGVVVRRNLDLGQIVVNVDSSLPAFRTDGERITSVVGETLQAVDITSSEDEHQSLRHYVEDVEYAVDEDKSLSERHAITSRLDLPEGLSLAEVSHYDHYIAENNSLKQIRVVRPGNIREIVSAFIAAVGS
jgi:hypothetical protein